MTLDDIKSAIGLPIYHEEPSGLIYNQDCMDVLPRIPDKSIDLVLTDPPYGIGKADWDSEFYFDWSMMISMIHPKIFGVMPGIANIARLPYEIGVLKYKWMLIAYLKNGMTRSPFGYGKYIPLLLYTNILENILLYTKDRDLHACLVRENGECMPDHPCPKPNAAIRYFISMLPGDLILDPFLGSGTTAVAAKQLGRKFIGIEISEAYCRIAVQRLSQEVLTL